MKKWMAMLCALLLLAGCGRTQMIAVSVVTAGKSPAADTRPAEPVPPPEPEPEPEPEPPPDPRQETVERLLAEMTLEEKVGQMFFARCPDVGAAESIGEYRPGGYLLFTRDFKDSAGEWLSEEDVIRKLRGYQEASPVPLLIGVDEEGGTVARASRNPNLFPEKRKSPQAVYALGGMAAIERDTLEINSRLLDIGVNVNLAPVADVSTDPADFIYDRAFGQDAEGTADFVRAAVSEMNRAGVGSVLKHFPGYGNNRDTHSGIATDERPYERFLAEDFLPFRAGIEAGAGAVLVSHNVVACMDPDLPASLSPEVHRILREELDFTGVVLTDDLDMDAVESYARDGSAAVLAVLAGNDMIVTAGFARQIPQVVEAVNGGIIEEAAIDMAVERVLGWKYDLGLLGGEYD